MVSERETTRSLGIPVVPRPVSTALVSKNKLRGKKMNRTLILSLLMMLVPSLCYSADNKTGSSKFVVWKDLKSMEPLKVAWDFNFVNPEDAHRALNPITHATKAN